MKEHKCGQVLYVSQTCVLRKVERTEKRQVEREREDESLREWTGIACV